MFARPILIIFFDVYYFGVDLKLSLRTKKILWHMSSLGDDDNAQRELWDSNVCRLKVGLPKFDQIVQPPWNSMSYFYLVIFFIALCVVFVCTGKELLVVEENGRRFGTIFVRLFTLARARTPEVRALDFTRGNFHLLGKKEFHRSQLLPTHNRAN